MFKVYIFECKDSDRIMIAIAADEEKAFFLLATAENGGGDEDEIKDSLNHVRKHWALKTATVIKEDMAVCSAGIDRSEGWNDYLADPV